MMQTIKINTVILALIILNLLLCVYLAYSYRVGSTEGLCLVKENGKPLACSNVQNSIYSSFLTIKVCHWGIASFILLLIIFLYAKYAQKYKKEAQILFLASTVLGSLIAVYFLAIQFFVLKTLCSTCIIIDVSAILIFILAYAEYAYHKRAPFGFRP